MKTSNKFATLFGVALLSIAGTVPASATLITINYNVSLAGNYHGLTYNVNQGDIFRFTNISGSYHVRIQSYLTSFTEGVSGSEPGEFDSGVFAPGASYDHLIVGPGNFHLATAFWQTPAARSTGYSLQDVIVTSAVPVPAAVWLMSSALLGLVGMSRKKKVV